MTKRCPKCGQSFADPNLNFCLNDGELLMYADDRPSRQYADEPPPTQFVGDDSPPTLMMNNPRVTDPIGWGGQSTPVVYQPTSPVYQAPQQFGMQQFTNRDQTLPIVAMCLGIASVIFVCCYGGLWLGIPAAVVGFLALRNTDNYPDRYSGRGLAIAGIVMGGITLVLSLILIFFGILGQVIQI